MSTKNKIQVPLTLAGFALAGAVAWAGESETQDCCAASKCETSVESTVFNPSTPLLSKPTGPVASGRVVFVGTPPSAAASGKAKFEGERPETKPLKIDAEKAAGCVADGGAVPDNDRSILISEDGGLANVVITIDVEGAEAKPAEKPVLLDQAKCRFEPHVVVITAGSKVDFLNSDAVSHNVHTYPKKNDPMNKTIEAGGKQTQVYAKTDQVEIKCDIHPWMNSFLIVTDAPYYAVTGADGSFSVEGVPAGTHKVEYWHEKLGKGKAEITVKDDGTAEPFEVKLGAKKKKGGRRRG